MSDPPSTIRRTSTAACKHLTIKTTSGQGRDLPCSGARSQGSPPASPNSRLRRLGSEAPARWPEVRIPRRRGRSVSTERSGEVRLHRTFALPESPRPSRCCSSTQSRSRRLPVSHWRRQSAARPNRHPRSVVGVEAHARPLRLFHDRHLVQEGHTGLRHGPSNRTSLTAGSSSPTLGPRRRSGSLSGRLRSRDRDDDCRRA
jgi:hypothetical protein